ncbi:MAG: hypothetical protein WA691_09535 [Thermoplasmata archaeon]
MTERGPRSVGSAGAVAIPTVALAGRIATGETNLQLTEPLLWLVMGMCIAGAIVTYAFLVYAVWRFRDPNMKGRRYG